MLVGLNVWKDCEVFLGESISEKLVKELYVSHRGRGRPRPHVAIDLLSELAGGLEQILTAVLSLVLSN